MSDTIKKGDTVVVLPHDSIGVAKEAVVLTLTSDPTKQVGVEFSEPVLRGHSCDNRGRQGHCWWVRAALIRTPATHAAETAAVREAATKPAVELDALELTTDVTHEAEAAVSSG